MDYLAIETRVGDRIKGLAREAAEGRLAHSTELGDARESMAIRLFQARLRPIVVRTASLVSKIRAFVARAQARRRQSPWSKARGSWRS